MVDHGDVRIREVSNVDIVADARFVRSWIGVALDLGARPSPMLGGLYPGGRIVWPGLAVTDRHAGGFTPR